MVFLNKHRVTASSPPANSEARQQLLAAMVERQQLSPMDAETLEQELFGGETEEEVLRVRNQIRAGLLMSLESPSSRAGQLARQQILWGRPIPLQETVDRINRIGAEL